MVELKENYIVSRYLEGRSIICQAGGGGGGGGPTSSRAGSNCLFLNTPI